ncbi:hypothetical protein ABFX02_01G085800 [Erythranthe guttata]
MSSNSSSSTCRQRTGRHFFCDELNGHTHPFVCSCGLEVVVQTSWTTTNPGRRFVCCPKRGAGKCKFFFWCDTEIGRRAKLIIPGLLRKIEVLQTVVAEQEARIRTWRIIALLTSVIVVTIFIMMVIL